jgi:hypothetical protein
VRASCQSVHKVCACMPCATQHGVCVCARRVCVCNKGPCASINRDPVRQIRAVPMCSPIYSYLWWDVQRKEVDMGEKRERRKEKEEEGQRGGRREGRKEREEEAKTCRRAKTQSCKHVFDTTIVQTCPRYHANMSTCQQSCERRE